MSIEEFRESLKATSPPEGLSPVLKAMWHDGRGDWESAHNLAQDVHSNDGSWVHAYLHRKEGDDGNAGYWYQRAGKPFPRASLNEEWNAIVVTFLAEGV